MSGVLLRLLAVVGLFGSMVSCQLAPPSDVALKIKPGADGTESIGFHVHGPSGGEFYLQNDNKGTLKLVSDSTTCLEIATKKAAKAGAEAAEPVTATALLQSAAKETYLRTRSRGGRRLLSKDEPVAVKKDYILAESITAGSSISVTGQIASTSSGDVTIAGVKQWKLISHEDFHKGTVSDWENSGDQFPLPANNGVSTCSESVHAYSDYFLGNYQKMEAKKVYILPPHERLRIKARVHFLDKWEGESVYAKIDGKNVWSERHSWCDQMLVTVCLAKPPSDGGIKVNVCGHNMYPDRLSVPVDIVLAHSAEALELIFGSTVEDKDASWGLDDVQIYLM